MNNEKTVGGLLKQWRERRRRSQMDLALDAEISTRHLSFVETGRAKPSREMILLLTDNLQVPLRERNRILIAGGYAPVYSEKSFDDLSATAVREAIDLILAAHEPFPALAVDRYWNIVAANRVVPVLLDDVSEKLLQGPVNVLRLSMHPDGLAGRIVNFPAWRAHVLRRLKKQADDSADDGLSQLFDELSSFSFAGKSVSESPDTSNDIVVPFQVSSKFGVLSFITTTTVFGTPVDVTVSEIALETFFPADQTTRDVFEQLAKTAQ
jgi:transcriptional regulator with XRE-family HTH domain